MTSLIQPTPALFFLVTITTLTSCSFDKQFLRPDKYPRDMKELTIKTPNDTLKVFFTGINHQPLFTQRNGRDTVKLNYSIESVVFKNQNGDTLNGWMLKPLSQKPAITLLHVHGNAGSLFSQYKAIAPLVKQGFQVFMFDYSGFGFSSGTPGRERALQDAGSALDYILTREDVKGTRLVIYGQSFGGHVAAVLAEKRQSDIDGLVIEGAFSSPKDIAGKEVPVLGRLLVSQHNSAKNSVRKFHKPVLVIHSTEDKVIPFKMGEKIYKAANAPKEFYKIDKCHICGPVYYAGEISEKIKGMIK